MTYRYARIAIHALPLLVAIGCSRTDTSRSAAAATNDISPVAHEASELPAAKEGAPADKGADLQIAAADKKLKKRTDGKRSKSAPSKSDAKTNAAEKAGSAEDARDGDHVALAPTPGGKPFAFPADGAGPLLKEKLPPAEYLPPDPVPYVPGPLKSKVPAVEQAASRISALPIPAATVAYQPRLTADDLDPKERVLRAIDLPAPSPLDAARPAPPRMIPNPKTAVASADPEAPTRLPYLSLPIEVRPTVATDPGALPARELSMASANASRRTPPPYLRIAIPDPFEDERATRLRGEIADTDAPSTNYLLPARPQLPVK